MKSWAIAIVLLVISFLLVIFLAPYASEKPDGLEYVAEKKGFIERTQGKEILPKTPLPDYSTPGIESPRGSTIVAGLVGTVVCFAAALMIARIVRLKAKGADETRTA